MLLAINKMFLLSFIILRFLLVWPRFSVVYNCGYASELSASMTTVLPTSCPSNSSRCLMSFSRNSALP